MVAWSHILWKSVRIISIALVPGIMSGFAAFVWNIDMRKGAWCDPGSKLQWHSVWHVFSAFSSLWVWLFYDFNQLKKILATSGQDEVSSMNNKMYRTKTSTITVQSSDVGSTSLFELYDEDGGNLSAGMKD